MKLTDWIKKRILDFLGIKKLSEAPDSERLTYISDDEEINIENIRAFRVWYLGDGDELLNYYTNQDVFGFARNPIYNRNKRHYFWGLSAQECEIKRVHSGVPKAIIDTLSNVIGMPKIDVGQSEPLTDDAKKINDRYNDILDQILEVNDFTAKLTQDARPMTMVEGWGAWKINIDKELSSDIPLIEYVDAENVEYIIKNGLIVGVMFKSYYKDKNDKNYVLIETRHRAKGNSYVDYDLFKLKSQGDVEPVKLDTIPELANLEPIVIEGLDKVLAVPTLYFFDPLHKGYGKSLFAGKLDLFDDLDQSLSQRSTTCRLSTPVEYFSIDALERGRDGSGVPQLPDVYDRKFILKTSIPDGDGNSNGKAVETTQPSLNFDQYSQEQVAILNNILIGLLSPATMGIDVAKKDNADAQREKEKVTIMTRNNIIDRETKQIRDLVNLLLMIHEYMNTGVITMRDYHVNIKYDEFANPSFDNEIEVLGRAFQNKNISTRKYVELLWGDKLSDEEKETEIQWLDEKAEADNMDMNALFGDGNPMDNGGVNDEETDQGPTGQDISIKVNGPENTPKPQD